jgi:hypothetical protein
MIMRNKVWISMMCILIGILCSAQATFAKGMKEMNEPRFEVGQYAGAESCRDCHGEIYRQWSDNSSHAVATSRETFHAFKEIVNENPLLSRSMDESMCYACHGPKEANEGVSCETCHGPVIAGVSIQETHERKYKPQRARMKVADFCAPCHTQKTMAGDEIFTVFSEWERSEAARNGLTCQECHMKQHDGSESYHGFDALVRINGGLYRDDLVLKNIKYDFPHLSVWIENSVTGHAVPAAGPSRFLVLEISLKDEEGVEIHTIVEKFGKVFKMMPIVGTFPNKLIENNQLRSGETRPLMYKLPAELKDRVGSAAFTLRFYDMADEHQGDLTKAHWISDYVLSKETRIKTN